jgi:HD superfamily phosphodiesterase
LATLLEIDHPTVLGELEALVRETYQLWDQEWVGFSWRNYTYDHVQRVRALARTICAREATPVADYAGLLHDMSKSYDGDNIGRQASDENGLMNEVLPPVRQNR